MEPRARAPIAMLAVVLLCVPAFCQTNSFRFAETNFTAKWQPLAGTNQTPFPSNFVEFASETFSEIFLETGEIKVAAPIPIGLKTRAARSGEVTGWMILAEFNPRNHFGGPTGRKQYAIFLAGKEKQSFAPF